MLANHLETRNDTYTSNVEPFISNRLIIDRQGLFIENIRKYLTLFIEHTRYFQTGQPFVSIYEISVHVLYVQGNSACFRLSEY